MNDSVAPTTDRLQAFPAGLPPRVDCAAGSFDFVRQFKHDFFAATGLYSNPAGRQVVLKIQRRRPFFGLPMGWLGGWLTRHEATIYRELADVPGVPNFVGFFGPTGFIHDYVPAHPLARGEKVSDTFFDDLAGLLVKVHSRGLACVDLNKRQNILVGDDGLPHLIDFQISFRLGRRRGQMPRAILAALQDHDWYHFFKHKRRCRPDLMTAEQIEDSYRRSGLLNLHRQMSWPYFKVRRWVLDRLHLPRGDAAEG
jgi:hypothetical protein